MSNAARYRNATLVLACLFWVACDGATGPGEGERTIDLQLVPTSLDLGPDASATVRLANRGSHREGPIQLRTGAVARNGTTASGVRLNATPAEIAALNPGDTTELNVTLVFDGAARAGTYESVLEARLDGETLDETQILFTAPAAPPAGNGRTVAISAGPSAPRQGDVVVYQAETRDSTGALVNDSTLAWAIAPGGAGLILQDGRFVGYAPGSARIVATASGLSDTLFIDIQPRGLSGSFRVVGTGGVSARYTSDLWVHGDHAYTGTWSCRGGRCGDRLFVWDVSSPAAPVAVDSVIVDATTVNDVKVSADGRIAVITHEGSSDQLNGVTILDLTDPAHPTVSRRYTSGLESGVHNVWIDGDYVYVVADGAAGLRILDVSDPSAPTTVASFYAGSSFLHDVYVRDGLAFLSHWDAGLVILDVGNGVAGGSPTNPVEVSRLITVGGDVHNAWYWPAAGYVFVGEEDFGTPGMMHVVDVQDLGNPKEVATFRVAGATPHNFWVDEGRGILFAAWYANGVRAVDVNGSLLGRLDLQGREIASAQYGAGAGCQLADATCTWAPQLHAGLVFASDMNTGLWVLEPNF